jgi:flap endonuclease-1
MGIQDLYATLKEHCDGTSQVVKLETLQNLKISIDISIFLYKFIKTTEDGKWINLFIRFLCILRTNKIQMICIFDGHNCPNEKKEEQSRRRATTNKNISKLNVLQDVVDKLQVEYIGENKSEVSDSRFLEELHTLSNSKGNVAYQFYLELSQEVKKLEKQTAPITKEHSEIAKEIIEILGIPCYQADGEAEGLCAFLAKKNIVDAVLSEDTDVLAYGTPYFLSKIDLKTNEVMLTAFDDVLTALNFTEEQFRDLCILLGCDYNERVKGIPPTKECTKHASHTHYKNPVSIGAKSAVCMMDVYKTLDEAVKYMSDSEKLNYKRCREVFEMKDINNIDETFYKIEHKPVQEERLHEFCKVHNVYLQRSYILKSFS